MEECVKSTPPDLQIAREAPQLIAVLKEMREGLDNVRNKIQALTAKVKAENFPTSDGISYLEVKHLLLLNYCQSLVYYLLRKAKGYSVQAHPVVRSLVEIRLFLEKIRPIDKKHSYQIDKMTRAAGNTVNRDRLGSIKGETDKVQNNNEDLLKYRPRPELLLSKANGTSEDHSDVYRPPKFAPSSMEEDKVSREEKKAMRRDKQILRQANQSGYVRDLLNEREGRPEEVRETFGSESREMANYISKMEKRAQQEEELFTRAPITKVEKKKMKQLMKSSRNGLHGLTESFYDEIKSLPIAEGNIDDDVMPGKGGSKKKRKRKY